MELNLISSITSTNIQKITFIKARGFPESPQGHTYWTKLDTSLCQLINQSRCKFPLEAEFQVAHMDVRGRKQDFGKYLPRFIESNGRVRVVNKSNSTIV